MKIILLLSVVWAAFIARSAFIIFASARRQHPAATPAGRTHARGGFPTFPTPGSPLTAPRAKELFALSWARWNARLTVAGERARFWWRFKRVCAWHRPGPRWLGGNQLARRVTHGICRECQQRELTQCS